MTIVYLKLRSEKDGEVDAAVIKQLLNSIDPTGNNSNPKNIREVTGNS